MTGYSRRSFAGLFLALLFPLRRSAVAQQPPAPQPKAVEAPPRVQLRHYRADAVILFLGIPIIRRSGVGGGRASMEETKDGASTRTTFQFVAGSDAKRAHGLNRMGWLREVVLGPIAAPTEITYFGVMTSSPEESFEHARKTIEGPQAARSAYSAVSGRHTAGHSEGALTHFEFPSDVSWRDQRLIDEAQSKFRGEVNWRKDSWPDSASVPHTFLCEMANLLNQHTRHAVGRYIYNEQEYSLELDAAQTGAGAARLLQVRGKVRNLATGHHTPFQMWMDEASGSVVPVRIDFQPRSYLRLTFEAAAE